MIAVINLNKKVYQKHIYYSLMSLQIKIIYRYVFSCSNKLYIEVDHYPGKIFFKNLSNIIVKRLLHIYILKFSSKAPRQTVLEKL